MILMSTGTIVLGDKVEYIKEFRVMFDTPLGLCATWEESIKTCEQNGFYANMSISPCVFAIGETLIERAR